MFTSREKVLVGIIVFLVVFQALSLAEINSLEKENVELKARVDRLMRMANSNITYLQGLSYNYSVLKSKYSSLAADYNKLRKAYRVLHSEYVDLKRKYNALWASDQKVLRTLSILSGKLTILYNESITNTLIPYAFKRTLNWYEIYLIRDKVYEAVGSDRGSFWLAIQDIYKWVITHVKYVHDTPHLLVLVNYTVVNGKLVISDLRFDWVRNYIQTPRETIELGQGDCDDMAVLTYAMIKYYMIGIRLHDQPLYIAKIIMNNGYAHMAVFLPTENGTLTIIDPAGRYLTIYISLMDSRNPLDELFTYSNYWSSYGGIKTIYLYEINVGDGSYRLVALGDVFEIAEYIMSSG